MNRRVLLSALLTLCALASLAAWCVNYPASGTLPFRLTTSVGATQHILPRNGVPLPAGIQEGDELDWSALNIDTRTGLTSWWLVGTTYEFVLRRDGRQFRVPVVAIGNWTLPLQRDAYFSRLVTEGLALMLALVTLWWGRDWVAWGLSMFAFSLVMPQGFEYVDIADPLPRAAINFTGDVISWCLGAWGLYFMTETLAAEGFTPRFRRGARTAVAVTFLLTVLAFAGADFGVSLAGWSWRPWSIAWRAGFYLMNVVVAIAFTWSYRRAPSGSRLRIRWVLATSSFLLLETLADNFGLWHLLPFGDVIASLWIALAMTGYLYATLRHQLVDLSFVLNRAIVYAAATALIVGSLASVQALVTRAAVGRDTGLLLQVLVPLLFGVAFNTLQERIRGTVERLFFRRKFLAESALKNLARRCAFVESEEKLIALVVEETQAQLNAPGVALYERQGDDYRRLKQAGSRDFSATVDTDDAAFVALRSSLAEIDLSGERSALGTDGYVYPLVARGQLLAALVCNPRPGEAYAKDERELLAQVAHEAGAALYALRARESVALMQALARGELDYKGAQKQAREFVARWTPG